MSVRTHGATDTLPMLEADTLPYAIVLVILTGITVGFGAAQPLAAVHTQGLHQSCAFWVFEESCRSVLTKTGYRQCDWVWDGEYGTCEFSSLCKDEFSMEGCRAKGCNWFEEGDLSYCHSKVGWTSYRVGIFCGLNVLGLVLGFLSAVRLESQMNVTEWVTDILMMFAFLLGANGVSLYLFGFKGGSETPDEIFEVYCLARLIVAFFVGFASHLIPQLASRAFPPRMRDEPKAILICCAACSYGFSIAIVYALEGVVWVVGGLEVCCVASTVICFAAVLVLREEFAALAAKPNEADSGDDQHSPVSVVASSSCIGSHVPPSMRSRYRHSVLTSVLMAATSQCCGLTIYAFYMPTLSVFLGMREMTGTLLIATVNAFFTILAMTLPEKYLPLHRLTAQSRYMIAVGAICSLLLIFSFSLRSYRPGSAWREESIVISLHVAMYHLLFVPAEAAAHQSMVSVGLRRRTKTIRLVLSGIGAIAIASLFPVVTQQVSHMNDSARTLNPKGLQHSIADVLSVFSLCAVVCAILVSCAVRKSIGIHVGYKRALID